MSVYERIKDIADRKNLTIAAVESGSGISNGSISKWKSAVPKADNLLSVSRYLNKSIEYFLTGVESTMDTLTPDQQEMLALYDQLDDIKRAEVRGYLKAKTEK